MPPARSLPYPLGVSLRSRGANVAVYSETAASVEVCVFEGDRETRTRLEDRSGHVFHGIVAGMKAGTRYALRVDGEWNPADGLRHNVHKLLLDPHATAVSGSYDWGQAVFAHDMNNPDVMDETDAAGHTPPLRRDQRRIRLGR